MLADLQPDATELTCQLGLLLPPGLAPWTHINAPCDGVGAPNETLGTERHSEVRRPWVCIWQMGLSSGPCYLIIWPVLFCTQDRWAN